MISAWWQAQQSGSAAMSVPQYRWRRVGPHARPGTGIPIIPPYPITKRQVFDVASPMCRSGRSNRSPPL